MSRPDRLALQRRPDKTFVLFGAVVSETKSDVTLVLLDGSTATQRKAGLVLVATGSLNHFARLDPAGLKTAFEKDPQAVFEQALVDSTKPVSVAELKQKLVAAALPTKAVDKAWTSVKKLIEGGDEVKVSGAGAARKLAWSGDRTTRLGAYVSDALPTVTMNSIVDVDGDEDNAGAEDGPTRTKPRAKARSGTGNRKSARPSAAGTSKGASDSPSDADDNGPSTVGLPACLGKLLGQGAPESMGDVTRSVLHVGSALSKLSGSELSVLANVDDGERHAVALLLLARDRPVQLRPGAAAEPLPPKVAAAAVESAIEEAKRSPEVRNTFARFAVRVLDRTAVGDISLTMILQAFAYAASWDVGSDPSRPLVELAGVVADRTTSSVERDWASADSAIADIAPGMNRIPIDRDGPRTRFLAGLYAVRRQHLEGDLLWRNLDVRALDQAAGGDLRRALIDPELAERLVKPEVLRFAADCSTRHDLGDLIALRGPFAQYIDAAAVAAAMSRIAQVDPKAHEWYAGLRQQELVAAAVAERDGAQAAAEQAQKVADDAERRAAKALAERDDALSALHRASEANAQASDAQLRQAKLDVLKSLASLAVIIKSSAAAEEDPVLLQRLGFALRREGLTEIATLGETVTYDPVLHDAQGEHIDPGVAVTVGRPGYTYDSGDEELVLVKALVSVV